MSKQSGTEVQVPDGSAASPSLAIGRFDTGLFITRDNTNAASPPARVRTVVAGVEQGTVDTAGAAPVDGVAATAVVTLNPNVAAGQSLTVGDQTYTFVAVLSAGPAVPYEVLAAGNKNASLDSLIKAINGTAAPSEHSATIANTKASAGARAGDDTTLTARLKGTAGNSIVLSNVGAGLANTAFASGVNGTVAKGGTIVTDGTNLFICLADAAITDSGKWKKITIGVL